MLRPAARARTCSLGRLDLSRAQVYSASFHAAGDSPRWRRPHARGLTHRSPRARSCLAGFFTHAQALDGVASENGNLMIYLVTASVVDRGGIHRSTCICECSLSPINRGWPNRVFSCFRFKVVYQFVLDITRLNLGRQRRRRHSLQTAAATTQPLFELSILVARVEA